MHTTDNLQCCGLSNADIGSAPWRAYLPAGCGGGRTLRARVVSHVVPSILLSWILWFSTQMKGEELFCFVLCQCFPQEIA